VFKRDRGYCKYCGVDLLANFSSYWSATVDHVIPVSAEGSNDAGNLVLACPACNGLLSRATTLCSFEERRSLVAERRGAEKDGFEGWTKELRTGGS
jgi:RNA polymerase subunit RPABC4/transcription elongation factor Spt4